MIAIIDYDAGNIKSVEKHYKSWDRSCDHTRERADFSCG